MTTSKTHSWSTWYTQLKKPSWTPAPPTIGRIWSILYPIILICYIASWTLMSQAALAPFVVIVFTINLVANLLFTPLQFGLRSLWLASLDILIVLATAIYTCALLAQSGYLWLALALIPYVIWVMLATVLQLSITYLNRQI